MRESLSNAAQTKDDPDFEDSISPEKALELAQAFIEKGLPDFTRDVLHLTLLSIEEKLELVAKAYDTKADKETAFEQLLRRNGKNDLAYGWIRSANNSKGQAAQLRKTREKIMKKDEGYEISMRDAVARLYPNSK